MFFQQLPEPEERADVVSVMEASSIHVSSLFSFSLLAPPHLHHGKKSLDMDTRDERGGC